jgi:hypothetical protein
MITLQNWKKEFNGNYAFFSFFKHNNKLNSQAVVGYFQVIQPYGRRYFLIIVFELMTFVIQIWP